MGLSYLHTQELRLAKLLSLSILVNFAWSQVGRRVFCYITLTPYTTGTLRTTMCDLKKYNFVFTL